MMFAGGASQASAQNLDKPAVAAEVANGIMQNLIKNHKDFFTEDILQEIQNATSPDVIKGIVRKFQIFLLDQGDVGMRKIVKARKSLENVLNKTATKNWSEQDFKDYQNRDNN